VKVLKAGSNPWRFVVEEVERKILAYDDDCMLVLYRMGPKVQFPAHKHPHRQYTFVVKGSADVKTPSGVLHLEEGDSTLLAPGEEHQFTFGSGENLFLDVFLPMRKDFLQ